MPADSELQTPSCEQRPINQIKQLKLKEILPQKFDAKQIEVCDFDCPPVCFSPPAEFVEQIGNTIY